MRDILDVHTHTVASGHAYNSMMEMIHAAQEKELEVYGITEHAPKMPGTCGEFYFHNLKVVPRKHGDLELLLHLFHCGTQPGLGHIQLLRCFGKALFLVDRVNIFLIAEHPHPPI